MFKIITFLFTTVLLFFATYLKAQTSSFASAATNKTWAVSKYFSSHTQEDKKSLFSNFSFKFINGDTTTFLAIDNSQSIADTCTGFWNDRGNNKVSVFLNLEPNDKPNYKVALLLNNAEMQATEISSSKLSFRIPDVMGYVDVEFTEK
jgi:hypothetical protein